MEGHSGGLKGGGGDRCHQNILYTYRKLLRNKKTLIKQKALFLQSHKLNYRVLSLFPWTCKLPRTPTVLFFPRPGCHSPAKACKASTSLVPHPQPKTPTPGERITHLDIGSWCSEQAGCPGFLYWEGVKQSCQVTDLCSSAFHKGSWML